MGTGQLGQALVKAVPTVPGRTGQGRAEPFEAALREGVEQRLFVGEVAARRGVADAQPAAEFARVRLPALRFMLKQMAKMSPPNG